MKRTLTTTIAGLATLIFGLPLSGMSAQNPDCPWVPRDGTWRLEAGNMSVDGGWTPLGGGELNVTLEVIDCGDRIEAQIPDGVGEVVFVPFEGVLDFPGSDMPGPIRDALDAQTQEIFGLPEELRPEGFDGAPVWDTPTSRLALAALTVSDANQEELLEPPDDLYLWQTNMYRANFRAGVGWYLDYVNQYSMFSTTRSEGVDPVHLQFHRWTFIGD